MFETTRPLTIRQKLLRINWLVLLLIAMLGAIGAATLTSVTGGSFEPWAQRHTVRCLAGLAMVVALALVQVQVWMKLAIPVYLTALALLVAVPFVGVEALGARRWLQAGGFSLQPSEVMKVGLVLALARYYSALPSAAVSRPHWVAVPLLLIALPLVLTLRQPDLGTAMLLAGLGLGVMFLAGVSAWYFAGGLAATLFALPAALSRLQDYQRRRIEIFLDPDSDPLGAGYHITQAKIALANGGLYGQGYLQGTQSQLDFVPEKMTDFIFVMIGEEWGFVGTSAVIGLYALLIMVLLVMALSARTAFARLVIAGVALSVAIYATINIGMVTGLVPVVGVPLPMISYGGTSMTTLMCALGIAMSAHVHGNGRPP